MDDANSTSSSRSPLLPTFEPTSINYADDKTGAQVPADESPPPIRSVIFVVTPLFMGYAALVSFQAHIKEAIGITDEGSADSYAFGVAVSLLFLAALVFRLCHNALLGWLKPRHRVMLALCAMGCVCGTVAVVFFALQRRSLPVVFALYLVGGAAIGTFEANVVSCITPLGHPTKKWALMGMPLGYNGLAIGGFGVLAADPGSRTLQGGTFGFAGIGCFGALLWFWRGIPPVEFEASGAQTLSWLKACIVSHWREWLPLIRWNVLSIFLDMFACILASTVALYVFHVDHVPLWPSSEVTIPYDAFQCAFNVCGFLGDFSARVVAYAPPLWWPRWAAPQGNPLRFTVWTALGLAMCLCKVAVGAPLGMLCIMFGNGMIYASTTRYIDDRVPRVFNLVAISVWLFVGDGGSYFASNLTTALSNAVGRV